MIDLREINETIDELKRKGDTIQAAERLALMYIAKDYMQREELEAVVGRDEPWEPDQRRAYSQAAEPVKTNDRIDVEEESEFLAACNGAGIADVLGIIDEHMEVIRMLYPREYDAIVDRIEHIKKAVP